MRKEKTVSVNCGGEVNVFWRGGDIVFGPIYMYVAPRVKLQVSRFGCIYPVPEWECCQDGGLLQVGFLKSKEFPRAASLQLLEFSLPDGLSLFY
jgi:hypothetical protein